MFDITSRVVELLGVGLTQSGNASLTIETQLTSAGTRESLGSASLSVDTGLDASALRKVFGLSDLAIQTSLSSDANATLHITITGEFDASLTGSANATFRSVASTLSVQSVLTSEGTRFYGGISALSTQTTFLGSALRISLGATNLTAQSGASTLAVRRTFAGTSMSSDLESSLSTAPVRIRYGDAALNGELATMNGTSFIRCFGNVVIAGELTTLTATPGTVYRLVLHSAERAITDDYLLKRYPIDVGLSLIVKDGAVSEVEVPSQTELAEADYYFLGGRNNPITAAQRATLIAAGFGSYIEEG